MIRSAAFVVLALAAFAADAAPDAKARAEIAGLMASLDGACRFQRNGKWYGAADARKHLQRKYEWLLERDLVDSAEQFIERAASRSSLSGKPYRVACPGSAEQEAGPWFQALLKRLRSTSKSDPKR